MGVLRENSPCIKGSNPALGTSFPGSALFPILKFRGFNANGLVLEWTSTGFERVIKRYRRIIWGLRNGEVALSFLESCDIF